MAHAVLISPGAERDLERLPSRDRERVLRGLEALGQDPFRPRPGCDIRKLKGFDPPAYALRVGDYRVLYAVIEGSVRITSVRRRESAYR